MRECIPPNLHDPQRAKGPLDRRSKRLSFPHFFLRRKKCGRRRPPPRQGETDSPPGRRSPPRAKGPLDRRSKWFSLVTFFLQKRKLLVPGHETPHPAPAGATPVRFRPRFPSRNRRFPDRCRSLDCASTAFRCRCLLLRQKLFVLPCRRLRNNYILCPTGTPTFAAARRQRRDLIIAKNDQRTNPYPHCCQRQRRKRYKRSPEPTTIPAVPIPRSQHRQICTCPPRAKGPLDRRSKWFSLVTFFLQKKKVTRAGARNSPPAAKY